MPYVSTNTMPQIGGPPVDGSVDGKPARICRISEAMLRVENGPMFAIVSVAHEDGKATYGCVGASIRPARESQHTGR